MSGAVLARFSTGTGCDKLIDKKGAWLQFEGELIGQGKDAAQKALVEKPEISKRIVDAIMAKRAAQAPA